VRLCFGVTLCVDLKEYTGETDGLVFSDGPTLEVKLIV